jgi:hypothetical protein
MPATPQERAKLGARAQKLPLPPKILEWTKQTEELSKAVREGDLSPAAHRYALAKLNADRKALEEELRRSRRGQAFELPVEPWLESGGVQYSVHPVAEIFPELNAVRFGELCEDIKKNGLLEPIVVHEGMILDGRHRLRACWQLGIKPRFVEFEWLQAKCTPEEYVWARNYARRHLTEDQRAAIVLAYKAKVAAEARERQR